MIIYAFIILTYFLITLFKTALNCYRLSLFNYSYLYIQLIDFFLNVYKNRFYILILNISLIILINFLPKFLVIFFTVITELSNIIFYNTHCFCDVEGTIINTSNNPGTNLCNYIASSTSSSSSSNSPVGTSGSARPLPANGLDLKIRLKGGSLDSDIDSYVNLIKKTVEPDKSLLVQSGAPWSLGIISEGYELPCNKIQREMSVMTNSITNSIKECNTKGVTIPHLLKILGSIQDTTQFLLDASSNSYRNINSYHQEELSENLKPIIKSNKNISLAEPRIASFLIDKNVQNYNNNLTDFYTFLNKVNTNVSDNIDTLNQINDSGQSANYEKGDNHVKILDTLDRDSQLQPLTPKEILDKGFFIPEGIYPHKADSDSIKLLKDNNFMTTQDFYDILYED